MKIFAVFAIALVIALPAAAQEWQPHGGRFYSDTVEPGFDLAHGKWHTHECVVASGKEVNGGVAIDCHWYPQPGTLRWYYERFNASTIVQAFLDRLFPAAPAQ